MQLSNQPITRQLL